LFIWNNNDEKEKTIIEIDNEFNFSLYNNNINFSDFNSTKLKPIAIYYPKYNYINENLSFNHINNEYMKNKILNQIRLAKNHGIFGFGINYIFYSNENNIYDKVVNIFLNLKLFHFLLILENSKIKNKINEIKNNSKNSYNLWKNIIKNFVKRIKKYLISDLYIKFKGKPILTIKNPHIFNDHPKILLILRSKLRKEGIKDIFIICGFNYKNNSLNYNYYYDATYDDSYIDIFEDNDKYKSIIYYSGLIYKNLLLNQMKTSNTIFRCSISENNNLYYRNISFNDFTPEKFYLLNYIIVKWTKINYNKTNGFFFINSWNNYLKGNYLEPDQIYGYSIINSFSKALFNLSFYSNHYNFSYLHNRCIVAIQVHVYYEELIFEVINKTNNIPLKFDLFISTTQEQILNWFEKYSSDYSRANKIQVLYVNNKGRDVLPFIKQMKNNFKRYKYICHIHTKKANHNSTTGDRWRNYLYQNLLGSREQISQILWDFEKIEKLGFIFPEPFYDIIKYHNNFDSINFVFHKPNINYMNFVLNKIFKKVKIGKKLVFPVGNMFWAKAKSIHQIFYIKFQNLFPKELGQINETIMHAIERIWLYLVKKNGYFYKSIFNHY
jgi:hypothetical protein